RLRIFEARIVDSPKASRNVPGRFVHSCRVSVSAPAGNKRAFSAFISLTGGIVPMTTHIFTPTRRIFLGTLGAAFFTTPGVFAEELVRTPRQTEGPFYPDHLPLDTDNDLLIINDSITPAVGEITHLSGRILGANGSPIRNAVVEIWQ